ncbi:hypothetical protein [Sphingomonas sp.]
MAKPPATPPSKDRGSEQEQPAAKDGSGAAEQEEVTRRGSTGRPPAAKR